MSPLTSSARRALKALAAATDAQRTGLARYRMVRRSGDPVKLTVVRPGRWQKVASATLPKWRDAFGIDGYHEATVGLKAATFKAVMGRPQPKGAVLMEGPMNQAADLEAQGVVVALILRDKGVELSAQDFEILTAAWQKAGLPL